MLPLRTIYFGALRASPVTSYTCICTRERKVGSIWDAEADAGKSTGHACIQAKVVPMQGKGRHYEVGSWFRASYLTSTFNNGRLIQIADSLHKSTLCREGVSSCTWFHPNLQLTGTTGPHSWICICIADEKVQMRMRIQDHWACPYGILTYKYFKGRDIKKIILKNVIIIW